jgi:hypothetical protein
MKKIFIILAALSIIEGLRAQTGIIDLVGSNRSRHAVERLELALRTFKPDGRPHYIILNRSVGGPKEGFVIRGGSDTIRVTGFDDSGVLYGSLALADSIRSSGRIPRMIEVSDAPEMVLRGACIGLQKPWYLPGRTVYEYPYTPETFPWFYDRSQWIRYLDMLVDNRMNALYLWNGHPFASLVRLPDYPYAVEVDEVTFKKNEEIYRFLTAEAEKRGIWVIQMFYNIIVSKPFAERHGLKTQDRERPIMPLIADYTRKSIAAFVEKYPNVGLMVCLGEAMQGVGPDDTEWFTQTILPGVRDGLKALGRTDEPPIVLRAHDTDAPAVMRAALPLYRNLYTEAKFNGEALTYERPRGSWAQLHRTLAGLGSVQIENVHILANLEPFRYGSPAFIRESVRGMHEVMGGNGLHLYPQASYWDWPYTADSVAGGRLLQTERDWIWYAAWSRYAWKSKREVRDEDAYWAGRLADRFGCSLSDGYRLLAAYEHSGRIAPMLLRRYGITDGNRQTLTLGMLMTQLINPYRFGLFTLLYECEAPEGESLAEYADRDWKGLPHAGETPKVVNASILRDADAAVAAIDGLLARSTRNKDELRRLQNDMHCYQLMARHFVRKTEAALKVLRYKYSRDIRDLDTAAVLLQRSLEDYHALAKRTASTYLYANSMQTSQRKIPMRGVDATFKHWKEMVPVFEKELAVFHLRIDSLRRNISSVVRDRESLPSVRVTSSLQAVRLDTGVSLFSDTLLPVLGLAPELKGLQGAVMSFDEIRRSGTMLRFQSEVPVKVVVGYFRTQRAAFRTDTVFLRAPELETNAGADDRGQSDVSISNAIVLKGMPPVDVHTYRFHAGSHELRLEPGVCLLLGFTEGDRQLPVYDAGLTGDDRLRNMDWLFE